MAKTFSGKSSAYHRYRLKTHGIFYEGISLSFSNYVDIQVFKEQPISNKNLLLIDGHAAAYHCWFTSYPNEVLEGFMELLEDLSIKYQADKLVVAFDPLPPLFRHLLYPSYKAGRPPAPEEFIYEYEELRVHLAGEGFTSVEVDGYEADDVLGTLSTRATKSGFKTTIATCDLDLLQLVNEQVSVELFSQYWPTRIFDVEKTRSRFKGLCPSQVPDYKALAGDRLDNLPGVPGIGDVTATALLHEKESVEGIYKDIDSLKSIPLRGIDRIVGIISRNKEQAYLMKKLTTIICDVEITIDLDKCTNPLLRAAEIIKN